jgi:FkbM family methyltransferase
MRHKLSSVKRKLRRLVGRPPDRSPGNYRKGGSAELRLDIAGIQLLVNGNDAGGRQYESRPSFETVADPLYERIARVLQPRLVVDIGANYGFTAIVFGRRFPAARLVLVEPALDLHPYIRTNLANNGVKHYELLGAICSNSDSASAPFALNPRSSQDNRVRGEDGWTTVATPSVTLSMLLAEPFGDGNVFIKIDTQGFETQVFDGGFLFLERNQNWLIKTEFAPYWLRSQGNDPVEFLRALTKKFTVVEAPARAQYIGDELEQLLSRPLQPTDAEPFTRHIQSLNQDGLGWCDLLAAPRHPEYLLGGSS